MKTQRILWVASASLLVCVAVSVAPLATRHGLRPAVRFEKLKIAVGNERLTEGRITGGFSYGPLRTQTRSDRAVAPSLPLLSAAAELQKLAEGTSEPGRLHVLGVAQLLVGRYADAIASLEVAGSQPDANVLSDSSAAFLAKGSTEAAPLWDYAKAIEASSRALALAPTHPEARFNRALALEHAHLPAAAVIAWKEYLAVDEHGGWADEARARLERLTVNTRPCRDGKSSGTCVDRLRTSAEAAIAAWADAPPNDAPAALQRARAAALEFDRLTGDQLLVKSVTAIEAASGSCRQRLAAAHRQFVSARALYDSDRRHEAFVTFAPASRDLRDCHSPFALWADINRAVIDIHARRLPDAIEKLDAIDASARAERFGGVSARSRWLRGVVRLHQAGPAAALTQYRQALEQYAAIGDDIGVGNVANAAADSFRIIGELPEGWKMLDRAISTLSASDDPVRRYVNYYNATLFSLDSGLAHAALSFQNEAVAEGRQRAAQAMLLEGLLNRAVVLDALGQATAALESLSEADNYRASITDTQQSGYMAARFAAVRGQIRVKTGALEARSDLTAAIDTFTTLESAELPRLHQWRARAALAEDRRSEADRDLLESLRLFEDRQMALADGQQRVSYADAGWTIYQDLIGLRIASGDWDEALEFAEAARARTLRARAPSEQHELDRLPADTVILFYLVRDDDTYVWTVTANGAQPHRVAISRAQLENHVRLLRWQIEHGDGEAAALTNSLKSLHQLLIAPAMTGVSPRRLVVIPDAFLARIPFQALQSPSGRYLVEEVEMTVAPSIDLFIRHLDRPQATRSLKVLAIGDPAFDTASSDLPRLPRARLEAERVAHTYADSVLLTDRQATAKRLRAELPLADVFHFAGHAVANVEFPELSRLMVAASDEPSGGPELSARDIAGIGIRPGALIVLSACRTGEGRIGGAEGPQSLGRAFLAAGAGAVVVSLWDVEDAATERLFEAFHQAYASGREAAAALRDAQLSMIAEQRPVRQWSAFHVVSGGKQMISSLKGAE